PSSPLSAPTARTTSTRKSSHYANSKRTFLPLIGDGDMGFLRRLLGKDGPQHPIREAISVGVQQSAEETGDQLVEVYIVGESFCQSDLARISGPKEAEGKQCPVGVTLRCEPT